jgi:hypothetical protein
MAFRFSWPEFDRDFYEEAKSQLETAMNKGNKPSVIVDHITVKELHMGTKVYFEAALIKKTCLN